MVCFEGVAVPVFVFVAVHGLSAVLAWGAVFVVVDEAFAGLLVGVAVATLCGVLFFRGLFFHVSPFFCGVWCRGWIYTTDVQCRYALCPLAQWGARHQQFVDLLRSAVASRLYS